MVIIYAERYMYASIVREPALSSKQLKMIASIMLERKPKHFAAQFYKQNFYHSGSECNHQNFLCGHSSAPKLVVLYEKLKLVLKICNNELPLSGAGIPPYLIGFNLNNAKI